MNAYKNIYFFLIDTLSPFYLYSLGNSKAQMNFFDTLMYQSTVLSNVISTGNSTYTAMSGLFTGFSHTTTGMMPGSQKRFNTEIYTLPELLRYLGYRTYLFQDKDTLNGEFSNVPMLGWDVSLTGKTPSRLSLLNYTNWGDCSSRREYINLVKKDRGSKFVYYHIELLHDLATEPRYAQEGGFYWTSEGYIEAISVVSQHFKSLYKEYNISDEDLVIISNDHGGVFDRNFLHDDAEYPKCRETGIRTFVALKGKGLQHKILSDCLSAVDIMPTILDLVAGYHHQCEGVSRVPYINGEPSNNGFVFSERNSFSQLYTKAFCLRDNNWKYVYSPGCKKSEWLINLDEGDYEINHLENRPDRVKVYKEAITGWRKQINKQFPEWYENRGYIGKRKRFAPIVFIVFDGCAPMVETVISVLFFFGPPFKILLTPNQGKLLPEKIRKDSRVSVVPHEKFFLAKSEWTLHLDPKIKIYPYNVLYLLYSHVKECGAASSCIDSCQRVYINKNEKSSEEKNVRLYKKSLSLHERSYVSKESTDHSIIIYIGELRMSFIRINFKRLRKKVLAKLLKKKKAI